MGGVGAFGEDGHGFAFGEFFGIAVGGGGGGEHQAPDASGAGGFEDVEGAGAVDVVVAAGIGDRAGDRAEGGFVEDVGAVLGKACEEGLVEDGALGEVDVGEVFDVRGITAGEVVEDEDGGAEDGEGFSEVGANEACAAGDEAAGVFEGVVVEGRPIGEGSGHERRIW